MPAEQQTITAVISANIRRRAEKLELNRLRLAKKTGITWNNLDAIWRGTVEPKLSTLQRIADALQYTVADLVKAE